MNPLPPLFHSALLSKLPNLSLAEKKGNCIDFDVLLCHSFARIVARDRITSLQPFQLRLACVPFSTRNPGDPVKPFLCIMPTENEVENGFKYLIFDRSNESDGVSIIIFLLLCEAGYTTLENSIGRTGEECQLRSVGLVAVSKPSFACVASKGFTLISERRGKETTKTHNTRIALKTVDSFRHVCFSRSSPRPRNKLCDLAAYLRLV